MLAKRLSGDRVLEAAGTASGLGQDPPGSSQLEILTVILPGSVKETVIPLHPIQLLPEGFLFY